MTEKENVFEKWYSKDNPQFNGLKWELLRAVRTREVGFISAGDGPTNRFYLIGDIKFLLGQLEERFLDTSCPEWNFYRSVEHIKHSLPKEVHSKLKEESKDSDKDFIRLKRDYVKEHYEELRWGWDLVLETDIKDDDLDLNEMVKVAKEETAKIKKFLDDFQVPYSLKYSGRRGFHFTIPWQYTEPKKTGDETAEPYLKKYFEPDDYPDVAAKLASFIVDRASEKYGLDESVVDMGNYNDKRLWKVEYTIHPETSLVALPLTNRQFEKFSIDMVEPEFVMNTLNLGYRRLKLRDGSLKDFIKEFQEFSDIKEYEREKQEKKRKMEEEVNRLFRGYESLPEKYKRKLEKELERRKG